MITVGLAASELAALGRVFVRHPEIDEVRVFGSRAKGNFRPESDVDLAIVGGATFHQLEGLGAELDDLPLPYRFDVVSLGALRNDALREHVERVGIVIYRRSPAP